MVLSGLACVLCRQQECPVVVSNSLFSIAARSRDLNMAAAAYKALVTLLGFDTKRVALFIPSNVPESETRSHVAILLEG